MSSNSSRTDSPPTDHRLPRRGSTAHRTGRVRAVLALIGVWLAIVAVYRVTERKLRIVDVEAVIRIPISLWNDGDLYLEEYQEILPRAVIPTHNGRVISLFPFWPAIHVLPVYFYYGARLRHFPDESNVWAVQRRAAQLSMATTTLLVGLLIARRHGLWIALLAALAFGFGTINWFYLSQLSFSNGLVQLWLALALYCGYRKSPPSQTLATVSLLAMVVAVFFRLNLAPVAGLWTLYLIFRLRRAALLPALVAAALAVGMAAGNAVYSGHPLGFYGTEARLLQFTSATFREALLGNLLSPSRGILVFSPWIAFAFVGLVRSRAAGHALVWTLFGGCLLHYVVTSSHWVWYGGGSLGPRLTADVLPLWSVLAAIGFEASFSRRCLMWLPIAAVGFSVVIAGAHTFSDSHVWPGTPVPLSHATGDRLFDWNDALVAYPFRKTPYEERYPIRLKAPPSEAHYTSSRLSFAWESDQMGASSHILRIAVWSHQNRLGVAAIELPVPLGNQLTVTAAALPQDHLPAQRLAWRVIALDKKGKRVARSGWRVFYWQPKRIQE